MPKVIKISYCDEVRRVPIGLDGKVEDYDDLLNAIRVTFPTTDGSTLKVTWKDEDGDTITMSSHAEFTEAMRSMSKSVPKFSITVTATPAPTPSTPNPTPSTPAPSNPSSKSATQNTTVHDDVECDGCGMHPIIGVRYKSTFRENYDLCEKCERTLKPTEPMAKLTQKADASTPSFAPGTLLNDTLEKVVNTLDGFLQNKEASSAWRKCHSTTAPLVQAVDQMCSRWSGVRSPHATQPAQAAQAARAAAAAPKPALKFLRDVSLPDGSQVCPGASLVKQWLVCNDGKTAWPEGVTLYTAGGDSLLAVEPECASPADQSTTTTTANTTNSNSYTNRNTDVASCDRKELPTGSPVCPPLAVHEERMLSVRLTAPQQPGRYVAYFRTKTAEGRRFGHRLWADIVVTAPESTAKAPVSQTQNETCESSEPSEPSDTVSDTLSPVRVSPATVDPLDPLDPLAASAQSAQSALSAATLPSTASFSTAVEPDVEPDFSSAPPLYWHQELTLLAEMGFEDTDTLVPLLEKFVHHPAVCVRGSVQEGVHSSGSTGGITSGNADGVSVCGVSNGCNASSASSVEEKQRVAQGLQRVLACLLGTRVKEVYI